MHINIIVTVVVVAYMLFMLWIGWYSSTRITSNTDFVVAGRRLGPFLMAGFRPEVQTRRHGKAFCGKHLLQ